MTTHNIKRLKKHEISNQTFANVAEERVEGQFRDQINALQAQAAVAMSR